MAKEDGLLVRYECIVGGCVYGRRIDREKEYVHYLYLLRAGGLRGLYSFLNFFFFWGQLLLTIMEYFYWKRDLWPLVELATDSKRTGEN